MLRCSLRGLRVLRFTFDGVTLVWMEAFGFSIGFGSVAGGHLSK